MKLIFEAVRAPTTPTSSHSRPWFSFILAIVGLNDFAEPVRGPLVRHMASDRQRASPIAPHPDRGFVQSGLCEVAIRDAQPAPQRPHITLQIPEFGAMLIQDGMEGSRHAISGPIARGLFG